MVDHVARPPLADRHLERVEHQLGAQVVRHGPPHDTTAPGVEHDREIEKAAAAGMKVLSATHSWFGPVALKSRSTRSGAGRASLSRRVVTGPPRLRLAPTRP